MATNPIYERALGGYVFEIVDAVAYERYWWGKSPSTREAFEAWLKDPEATQIKVSLTYGRSSSSVFNHVANLKRRGILRKFKRVVG